MEQQFQYEKYVFFIWKTKLKKIYFPKVCDFIIDCKTGDDERLCGNCTFDETTIPLCGWNDVSQGLLMWKRASNDTLEVIDTGPPFDHTTYNPSGNYVYVTLGNDFAPDVPCTFDNTCYSSSKFNMSSWIFGFI